jgi:hypothetical protein
MDISLNNEDDLQRFPLEFVFTNEDNDMLRCGNLTGQTDNNVKIWMSGINRSDYTKLEQSFNLTCFEQIQGPT